MIVYYADQKQCPSCWRTGGSFVIAFPRLYCEKPGEPYPQFRVCDVCLHHAWTGEWKEHKTQRHHRSFWESLSGWCHVKPHEKKI